MKPNKHSAIGTYFRNQTQNAVQHTLTGIGISALLLNSVHVADFISEKRWVQVLLICIIGLTPLIVDFAFFLFKDNHKIQEKLREMNTIAMRLDKNKNKYHFNSLMSRIEREIFHLKKMEENNFTLPALQNYEYVREVMMRILLSVMSPGDKYITISNLDFWVVKPGDPLQFFRENMNALKNHNKSIARIVVLDPKIKDPVNSDVEGVKKQTALKKLLEGFTTDETEDENYFSDLKTLFLFDDDYENHIKYLLSAIIISWDFKNLMFVKINNWNAIESVNPSIQIKYFTIPGFGIKVKEEDIKDTPKILKVLYSFIGFEIKNNNADANYSELFDFLRSYNTAFSRMNDIYGKDGLPNNFLHLDKTPFYNLKMLKNYYNL